jgi:hypothetical protein
MAGGEILIGNANSSSQRVITWLEIHPGQEMQYLTLNWTIALQVP